jgi:type II secretory pathway pseudopilin PulG
MPRRRQGFTLVELLVSMALIIFIMAILSGAFVAATDTFRNLKASGDLAEKLRSATSIMRRYLAADHFDGKRRLSDPNFWQTGPPREGFFRVWNTLPSTVEGIDLDGNPSYRSTTHALHFSVKLRGNQRGDFFSSSVPAASTLPGLALPEGRYEDSGPTVYNWQWAEVAFFLHPNGSNAFGTPLFSLFMRQLLATPDNNLIQPPTPATLLPQYLEVSCQPDVINPTNLYYNSPLDLTMPARRFGMTPGVANLVGVPQIGGLTSAGEYPTYASQAPGNTSLAAADLLLSNVISFDVRFLLAQPPTPGQKWPPTTGNANWDAFEDLFQITNPNRLPVSYPVSNSVFAPFAPTAAALGSGPLVFDTWSGIQDDTYDYTGWATPGTASSIPILNNSLGTGQITIRAIQVTLRIWDDKTTQTRQVTFVQEL